MMVFTSSVTAFTIAGINFGIAFVMPFTSVRIT